MSVIGSNIIAGASGTVETGYQIARSLRFNSADSAYLNRTPGSAGNRKTWTWSGWVKRSALGAVQNLLMAGTSSTDFLTCQIDANNKLSIQGITGNVENIRLVSTPVYRDISAWYNIVFVLDLNNATQADRFRIYVNGVRVTAFDTNTNSLASTQSYEINNTVAHAMGRNTISSSVYVDLYYADLILIDGQALTPSDFGQTDSATGVWVPKAYTGTYGTNGFWLKFDDNSGVTATTLGKDSSGNSNNWTPNNFSVTAGAGNDSLVDSPTNYGTDTGAGGEVRGNYATLNPLTGVSTGRTLANGNLDISTSASKATTPATIAVSSGKWYWEVTCGTTNNLATYQYGIVSTSVVIDQSLDALSGGSYSYYGYNGNKISNTTSTSYGATFTNGDVIGHALDLDAGTLTFYKNGVSQGTAFTGLSGTFYPAVCSGSTGSNLNIVCNFGQRPFAYTAPSGFKALCTQNLPTPAVGASASTLANKYMDVSLYTGTGAVQSVTNSGSMQPDFVWLKNRNSTEWHSLFDAVRGALQNIRSNSTNAEVTATGTLTSFNSNGFSLGTDPSSYGVNTNTFTYVAWQWKANGAGSSNTAGSITSTVSANTTAGISVVTWTNPSPTTSGWTVGHGLGVAPKMVIVKQRSAVSAWYVYHASVGAGSFLQMQATNTATANTSVFNNTAPTSTVFSLGGASGNSYYDASATAVAYCFAEVAGFSKFGSYTGNGNADGPFVFTGFRPRWIMIKRTDVANSWVIVDTVRNTYNVAISTLYAEASLAEESPAASVTGIDILSNGFKPRDIKGFWNTSSGTYIFAAFGESPFNYARAR